MRVFHYEVLFTNGSYGDVLTSDKNYKEELSKGENVVLVSTEMVIELEDLNNYIESLKS